jgi:predicted CXXCH cytochrome family protein
VIATRLALASAIAAWASIAVPIVVSGVAAPQAAAGISPTPSQPSTPAGDGTYVGSAACRNCHAPIYNRWTRTRMANVVRDPKTHPDAIIPDLSKPDPLVTFKKDDIAFVYGSKWKQRYFTRVGDDYYPLGAQWDVTHKMWRRYFVADNTDWWVPHYPADNLKRPTGPTCDGCHSVNYDVRTRQVAEWNVGCEKCHGAGGGHAANPSRANIFNPARADAVHASDVCIQCHSQGQPLKNPIEGRYFDWPVGFHVGLNLSDFWKLEEPELGKTTFTHFADGTAHKNRMQGNDFVTSVMYERGVTCFSCHDVHGTANNADLLRPASTVCLQCHGAASPNGPHAPTIEQHTHHRAGSTGSECVGCHMPKIEQTIADVNVRSHTFRFIPPSATERLKVPNSCTSCHTDKSDAWAGAELKKWPEFSPWRVAP